MAMYEELMVSYFGNEELTRLSFVRAPQAHGWHRQHVLTLPRPLCAMQGLLRSAALFAGSVVLMRLYGDSMAV